MNAKIQPLKGKYYGTTIELDGGELIEVWIMGDWTPSARQLEYWGMTLQEAQDDGMMCDSHYESADCYKLVERIVKAINNPGLLECPHCEYSGKLPLDK